MDCLGTTTVFLCDADMLSYVAGLQGNIGNISETEYGAAFLSECYAREIVCISDIPGNADERIFVSIPKFVY